VINKKAHFNQRTLLYFKKVAWSFLIFKKAPCILILADSFGFYPGSAAGNN